jgi:hypothetical protein
MLPTGNLEAEHYTTSCNTQSSAPEDGRDQPPKHVDLIGIINKPLLWHLVGVYIIYIQRHADKQISKLNSYLAPTHAQYILKRHTTQIQ